MNKPIKALAKQAGIWFEDTKDIRTHSVSTTTLERFAELIVRECAEVANDHNSEAEGITLGVGRVIKEHFGVEE